MTKLKFRPMVFFSGLALAILLYRLVFVFFVPETEYFRRARAISEAIAHLPQKEHLALFFGLSEIENGVVPKLFDETLGHGVVSYNFGIRALGGIMPLYFDYAAAELERQHISPDLIVVHVPPSRLTIRSKRSSLEVLKSKAAAPFYMEPRMLGDVPYTYDWQISILLSKYLFDGRSADQLSLRNGASLQTDIMRLFAKGESVKLHRAFTIYRIGLKPTEELAWNEDERGAHPLDFDREVLEGLPVNKKGVHPSHKKYTLLSIEEYEACCDLTHLEVDQAYLDQVLESLRELRKAAKHVVYVALPESPLVQRTDAQRAHVHEIEREIATRAGIEFWDLGPSAALEDADYADALHVNYKGADKISRALAKLTPRAWIEDSGSSLSH